VIYLRKKIDKKIPILRFRQEKILIKFSPLCLKELPKSWKDILYPICDINFSIFMDKNAASMGRQVSNEV
jgi:hypothetical protein